MLVAVDLDRELRDFRSFRSAHILRQPAATALVSSRQDPEGFKKRGSHMGAPRNNSIATLMTCETITAKREPPVAILIVFPTTLTIRELPETNPLTPRAATKRRSHWGAPRNNRHPHTTYAGHTGSLFSKSVHRSPDSHHVLGIGLAVRNHIRTPFAPQIFLPLFLFLIHSAQHNTPATTTTQ